MARFSHLLTANTWRHAAGWAPDAIQIDRVGSGTVIEENVDGTQRATIEVPVTALGFDQLVPGKIATLVCTDGTWSEWELLDEGTDPNGTGVASFACAGYARALQRAGLVGLEDADGVTLHTFELGPLSPTDHLNATVMQGLSALGLGFFELGQIDPTIGIIVSYDADSRYDALKAIASACACEYRFRRNDGTGKVLIDLTAKIGVTTTAEIGTTTGSRARLAAGENAHVTRTRSALEQVTRVYPLGPDGTTIAQNQWLVTAKSTNILTLADPAGGDGPVGMDDQLNGLYLEAADRSTRVQITDCTFSNQQVVVSSGAAFTVGDRVRVVRNSAGAGVTYLDDPARVTAFGVHAAPRVRSDVPGIANLIPNPTMAAWAGASTVPPDGWATVGSPTLTRTTTAGFYATGGKSCRVQSTTEGHGLATPLVKIRPTMLAPYVCGFLSFRLATGNIRVELVATDGTSTWVVPDGITTIASTSERGVFTAVGIAGQNLHALGATSARIRIVQHGSAAADFYVDAGQLTETAGQQPFIDGVGANILWQDGNRTLQQQAAIPVRFDATALDLFRYDGTAYPTHELILGAMYEVMYSEGVADGVRLLSRRQYVMDESRTEVTLSSRPEDFVSIQAARDPVARSAGNLPASALPPNARVIRDADVSAFSNGLYSPSAGFTATDVGKTIWVPGAGTSGALLKTTITARTNATLITMGANAGVSATGLAAIYGDPGEVATLAVDLGGSRASSAVISEAGRLAAQVNDAQGRDLTRLYAKVLAIDPDDLDGILNGTTYRKSLPFIVIKVEWVSENSTTVTVLVTSSDPSDAGAVTISHNGGGAVTDNGGGSYTIAKPSTGGLLTVLFTGTKTGCISQSAPFIVPPQDIGGGGTIPPSIDAFYDDETNIGSDFVGLTWASSNEPSGETYDLRATWSARDATGAFIEGGNETLTAITSPYDWYLNALGSGTFNILTKNPGVTGYLDVALQLKMRNASSVVVATATHSFTLDGDFTP